MRKLCTNSTVRTALAASLTLVMLARLPFADGLLLHDHSDHGVHAHSITPDDLRQTDHAAMWHGHDHEHDGGGDERGESDGTDPVDPPADPLLLFVNSPATVRVHVSSAAAVASIQRLSTNALPRYLLPSNEIDTPLLNTSRLPSTLWLRPDSALDALLLSSHALLL